MLSNNNELDHFLNSSPPREVPEFLRKNVFRVANQGQEWWRTLIGIVFLIGVPVGACFFIDSVFVVLYVLFFVLIDLLVFFAFRQEMRRYLDLLENGKLSSGLVMEVYAGIPRKFTGLKDNGKTFKNTCNIRVTFADAKNALVEQSLTTKNFAAQEFARQSQTSSTPVTLLFDLDNPSRFMVLELFLATAAPGSFSRVARIACNPCDEGDKGARQTING